MLSLSIKGRRAVGTPPALISLFRLLPECAPMDGVRNVEGGQYGNGGSNLSQRQSNPLDDEQMEEFYVLLTMILCCAQSHFLRVKHGSSATEWLENSSGY